jgi:hypothetical protein
MKLVKISDLVGENTSGMKADIRSRNADGSLKYPTFSDYQRPIIVTMRKVELKGGWLYWRWDGYSCGFSGVDLNSPQAETYHIMIDEKINALIG